MKALGVILVVVGLVAIILPAINFTRKETVFELGPLEVTNRRQERVSLSPLLGVTFLAIGGGLLVAGAITGKR